MADRAAPLAVAQLVEEHHPALYRYAYRLTGSVPDAEDLTQEVFLIAQEKLGQVRDALSVRGWLFTVLRNCYLKTRQKRLALPMADLDCSALPEQAPRQPIDSHELQTAIDTLPDEFKLVVLMFYFEHRSYRQIAELLDVPIGTVMSRLARAKAHLRHELTPKEPSTQERTEQPEAHHPGPTYHHPTATRR
jgi:RNA polymerase sigma-70 factor, ECF subfamily